MRARKWTFAGVAALLLLLVSAAAVGAQPMPLDKRTYFTFNGPVTLPNITLPQGKYIFRFVDNSQWVMEVLAGDGKTTYGLMFTRQVQRPDIPDKPEVRFLETPPGMPHAVQTWWYPGMSIGWELVYPKDQARRLAKGAQQPVLTTVRNEPLVVPSVKEPDYVRVSPGGDEMKVTIETTPPVAAGGPSQTGEVAPPSMAFAQPKVARTALPKTASAVPLVALLGMMLIVAAAVSYMTRVER